MRRPISILVAGALMLGPAIPPLLAADHLELNAYWTYCPESGKSHPKKIQVVMVADESFDLAACHLWYFHDRYSLGGSGSPPAVPAGGRMTVTLKRIGERGKKTTIATYGKDLNPAEEAAMVGWSDSPMVNQLFALSYGLETRRSGKFPFHVEAGDMLLWIVKVNGAPRLEVDRDGPEPFSDGVSLWSWCESCGTVDHPCADWWTNDD